MFWTFLFVCITALTYVFFGCCGLLFLWCCFNPKGPVPQVSCSMTGRRKEQRIEEEKEIEQEILKEKEG